MSSNAPALESTDASAALPAAAVEKAYGSLAELKILGTLAAPVVLTQIGSMALGLVDTLMIGRTNTTALDAASLGNLWIFGTLIMGMGMVMGIDPIVTQAHGRGDGRAAGVGLQRGLAVALLASIPIGILWLFTEPVLILANQDAVHAREAARFVWAQLPTMPFFLGFVALRSYLQGRGILAPTLWVIVLANIVNAAINYVLIFGNYGFPEMGLVGSGIASATARAFMFLALAGWIVAKGLHRGAWAPWSFSALSPSGLGDVLKYGFPVGLQYGLEVWAFQIATLLAGVLGKHELGAHAVVLNMASVSFMLPLGISHAAAVRVGNLIGARDHDGAQRAAWVSFGLGAAVMTLSAVGFLVFRNFLPRVYGVEPEVALIAASVLPIAAAFQLFDGLQAVGGGILRGMGRIRPAYVFNLFGYYALALPLAGWLAFPEGKNLGLAGLWWGLALGLLVIALSLIAWVAVRGPAKMPR